VLQYSMHMTRNTERYLFVVVVKVLECLWVRSRMDLTNRGLVECVKRTNTDVKKERAG